MRSGIGVRQDVRVRRCDGKSPTAAATASAARSASAPPPVGGQPGRLENPVRGGEHGPGADGVGRAEEADDRHAEGVRQVHAAGVVRDQEAAPARGAAANPARLVVPARFETRAGVEPGGDLGRDRRRPRRVPNSTKRSPGSASMSLRQCGDGPALGRIVLRAGDQADRGPGRRGARRRRAWRAGSNPGAPSRPKWRRKSSQSSSWWWRASSKPSGRR